MNHDRSDILFDKMAYMLVYQFVKLNNAQNKFFIYNERPKKMKLQAINFFGHQKCMYYSCYSIFR